MKTNNFLCCVFITFCIQKLGLIKKYTRDLTFFVVQTYLINLRSSGGEPIDIILGHLGKILLVCQHQNFGAFFIQFFCQLIVKRNHLLNFRSHSLGFVGKQSVGVKQQDGFQTGFKIDVRYKIRLTFYTVKPLYSGNPNCRQKWHLSN